MIIHCISKEPSILTKQFSFYPMQNLRQDLASTIYKSPLAIGAVEAEAGCFAFTAFCLSMIFVSSSWCHGLVCDLRVQHFLVMYEPWNEISNKKVCATSKGSDQPAQTRSLIRAFASRLSILWLLSYYLNTIWVSKLKRRLQRLVRVYNVKMPHCWNSHATAQLSCKIWWYAVKHMFHSLDLLQLFDNFYLNSTNHEVAEVVDKITIRHMYELG